MVQHFHISGAAAGPYFGPQIFSASLIRSLFEKIFRTINSNQAERVLTIWNLGTCIIPNLIELFFNLRHYTRLFFTSAVTIRANDELYLEVLNWLAIRQSQRRFINEYNAHTLPHPYVKSAIYGRRGSGSGWRAAVEETSTIKYTPAYRTMWFFYGWNLLAVLRNDKHGRSGSDANNSLDSLAAYDIFDSGPRPRSIDTVTITCLGWSTKPIEDLLKRCREMAKVQKRQSVTIWSGSDMHWAVSGVKPARPLHTIHLEEEVKINLIIDIERYLDPQRRQFYGEHGIPYRRGYLLHGPPGCGKSSLSLALAGFFGLDLYIVNLSSVYGNQLVILFSMLPARCFVLLEDIDAVGLAREEDLDMDFKSHRNPPQQPCSFSSLLNVLDGVASQEGRVVIMTSNFPEKLDEALVRPGRIDVRVFMGHISRLGAEQMFMRMMRTGRMDWTSGAFSSSEAESLMAEHTAFENAGKSEQAEKIGADEELQVLAQRFAQQIPEGTLTPAQLQGYLLQYLESATMAVEKAADWVVEEKRRSEKEAERKEDRRKSAEQRKGQGATPSPVDPYALKTRRRPSNFQANGIIYDPYNFPGHRMPLENGYSGDES
ncbi:P-loop containing nucleoside triphosphate hydrolase protein [Xylaria nigripes]|nr:P-loop containing nucleoside triphosphate hydrolase protein [Xylaria nigripes]